MTQDAPGGTAEPGAFTAHGPWVVDPGAMPWRRGVDALRARTAAGVPDLVRRRRVPPLRPVVRAAVHLGPAVALWAVRERGTPDSRRALSHRLRVAFARLGPTYVKLGQIVSAGEGLFPPELVGEFRLLRDRVPAEPFAVVRRTVEEDLGAPLGQFFSFFDERPVAAASIAQVHRATLRSGADVVVKVQRRTVRDLVTGDLAALAWAAPFLVGRIPVAALANPPALVELFAETVAEELDFRLEAQNMLDIAAVLSEAGQHALVVPRPHPDLVTSRVLVMERLDGFGWNDHAAMRAAGIDTAAALRAALLSFLEGCVIYGVFHGDLHGGNLLVLSDGTVGLLDFGITGRLDERRRLAFLRLQLGVTGNDLVAQVEALRDLGALPVDTDPRRVIVDLGLEGPVVDPTTLTADELLVEMRAVTSALLGAGARLPKELMLFVKDLLFLNGALATMAPDVDILAEITAVAAYFAQRHAGVIARDLGPDGNGPVAGAQPRETGILCDKCNKPMVIRAGRFGEFLSCTGYPTCKNARPVPLGVACPKCGGDLIEVRPKKRGGRTFYGCSNYMSESIKCDFKLWQKPIPEPCPLCKAPFLVYGGTKAKPRIACADKECGYTREIISAEDAAEEAAAAARVARPSGGEAAAAPPV